MSAFKDLLGDLSSQTGIPKEQMCGEEPVNLIFDGKIGTEISNDTVNEEVCLTSRLFQVDDEESMGAMALLIAQANFEKDKLYGAHLAMSEEGLIVLLCQARIHSLDSATFGNLIKKFVDAAEEWSDSLASMSQLLKEHHDTDRAMDEKPGDTSIKV